MNSTHPSSYQQSNIGFQLMPSNKHKKSGRTELKPNINLNEYPEYLNGRRVPRREIRRPQFIIDKTHTTNCQKIQQTNKNLDSVRRQHIENRQCVAPEMQHGLNVSKNTTSKSSKQKNTTNPTNK